MNPHKHLDVLRELVSTSDNPALVKAFTQLDEWLFSGGALPCPWNEGPGRDAAGNGAWTVGNNIIGHELGSLSGSFACWADALVSYVDMCREWADNEDEAFDREKEREAEEASWYGELDLGVARPTVESILKDTPPVSNEDYSMSLSPNGLSFDTLMWIKWDDEASASNVD